jgi:hypothetical protein
MFNQDSRRVQNQETVGMLPFAAEGIGDSDRHRVGLDNPTMTEHHDDPGEIRTTGAPKPLIRPVMPELDTIRGLAILGVLFYHGFY